MENNIPELRKNAVRVTIELTWPEKRLDNVLLDNIRNQTDNLTLKNISRSSLKQMFADGKIQIKGQKARPSSSLAKGTTYIDIFGLN